MSLKYCASLARWDLHRAKHVETAYATSCAVRSLVCALRKSLMPHRTHLPQQNSSFAIRWLRAFQENSSSTLLAVKNMALRMVDVGALPCTKIVDGEKRRGFKIFLGGGLGNKSFIGHQLEDFTPEEDFLYTAIAAVQIFDRLGDRKNLARNRMRYLVHEMGWEKFQNLILKAFHSTCNAVATVKLDLEINDEEVKRPLTVSEGVPQNIPQGYDRWLETNTIKQAQLHQLFAEQVSSCSAHPKWPCHQICHPTTFDIQGTCLCLHDRRPQRIRWLLFPCCPQEFGHPLIFIVEFASCFILIHL